MSAKCFVNVTREQMNVMEKISIPESTRDAIKFGVTLFKIEIWKFSWKTRKILVEVDWFSRYEQLKQL